MDTGHMAQPSPTAGALGLYAAANAALAIDVDAGALDRYLERLAQLTGCDLILVYERPDGDNGGWVLAGQCGAPVNGSTQFRWPRDDSQLRLLLQQSGVRAHVAVPFRTDGGADQQTLFCSQRWDQFNDEILSVFAATAHEVGRALQRRCAPPAGASNAAADSLDMRQHFIAVLAHELRNPIAPIRSGLDLMATELLDTASRQTTVAMMRRQLDHLVRLIDDLLDTVRLRTGRLQVKRAPVVLRDVVRAAIECIRPALFAKHLALRLEDAPSDVVLHVDPVRLSQAFVNVLRANVKQTPEGGVVSIVVTKTPDTVHVIFEDEAPNVDPKTLSNVFDLFPKDGPQRADDGLGIGLALVRGLVELNDGTVVARPREPQAGTSYVVSLPLPAGALADPAPVDSQSPGTWASHRILIVDDNLDAANTLGLLLELDGATVRLAHDGPAAVDEARQFQPEVILLDIGIPGFDGNEAARRIRAMNSPVRPIIVALTGWGAKQDRDATAASGFDLHLVKPILHEHLRTQVFALMGREPHRDGPN